MAVENELFAAIAKVFNKDVSELTRETRFLEDLHAKSQMMWAVAAIMEKMAGAKVSYADANACVTLGEAVDLVEKLKG